MKREIALSLAAPSQLDCFVGPSRSAKSPPSQLTKSTRKIMERLPIDRSGNSIDEVRVSIRNKRVKTGIFDADSMNVDKSRDNKEVTVPEVAKGEEEPADAEVNKGAEEPTVSEVAKDQPSPSRSIMKRELALALAAPSQLDCFVGRPPSAKSPSSQLTKSTRKINEQISSARSGISIDDVRVSIRNKRVKTVIFDGDSINVDKSKDHKEVTVSEVAKGEELAAAEVNKGEEEPTPSDVAKDHPLPSRSIMKRYVTLALMAPSQLDCFVGRPRSVISPPSQLTKAKGEEEGIGVVEKVYVKREMRKNKMNSSSPKRFTRSALNENAEKVDDLGTPTRKKLELKMSKKIGLGKMPSNMRELLETGLLEGFRVFYNFDIEGRNLQGLIKGAGILCSCDLCAGTEVISPSQFEMHARKSYRNAVKYICLENGKSLLELVEMCKAAALETLEVALQTVISSLPVKGPSMCTRCNNSMEPSTTNLLICESCMDKKQVEVESRVSTPCKDRSPSPVRKANAGTSLPVPSDKKIQRGRKRKAPSPGMSLSSPSDKKFRRRGRPRKAPSPVRQANAIPSLSLSISTDKTIRRRGRPRKGTSPVRKADASPSLSLSIPSDKKIRRRGRPRKSSTSASVPMSIESATKGISSQQKSQIKLTMKNQQLHRLVFEEGGLPDGTELTYVCRGQKLLDGYKLGHGIYCFCCQTEVSASLFEAHAGWASRKKPYENIYISNGVSLHEYAVSLQKSSRCPVKFNDDLCRVCWDGGNLLLCDGCPRAFHQECISESSIPHGKWYCKYCQQSWKVTGDSANALAAGRIAGIDPIEQITKRCIRIVNNPINNDSVACILCRCRDFSKNVFNDRMVIVCDQCEKEYHIGCLREHGMADLKALPQGEWFCCMDCERIHSALTDLLTREPDVLPDALSSLLREKQKDKELESNANSEIRFVLLSGKNALRENRPLLAQSVDIFHECFDPIIDAATGRDFIPSMVYGRKMFSQDFAGMLCAILTIDSNVITAGTLRVLGADIAELPMVATSKCNQGKGYFQILFTCIERLLVSLKIKKIVLPAAEEAQSIWTNKFGFQTIAPQQLGDLKQKCPAMMTFKGTSMLQKEISQAENGVADGGDVLKICEAQNEVADDGDVMKTCEAQNDVADGIKTCEAQNEVADGGDGIKTCEAETDVAVGGDGIKIREAENGAADGGDGISKPLVE